VPKFSIGQRSVNFPAMGKGLGIGIDSSAGVVNSRMSMTPQMKLGGGFGKLQKGLPSAENEVKYLQEEGSSPTQTTQPATNRLRQTLQDFASTTFRKDDVEQRRHFGKSTDRDAFGLAGEKPEMRRSLYQSASMEALELSIHEDDNTSMLSRRNSIFRA